MQDDTDAPRHPVQCLDGFADVLGRLENDLAITVKFVSLPDNERCALDGPSRTFLINKDKPLKVQVWSMIQCWKMVTLGPDTCPEAIPERNFLHLIAAS